MRRQKWQDSIYLQTRDKKETKGIDGRKEKEKKKSTKKTKETHD